MPIIEKGKQLTYQQCENLIGQIPLAELKETDEFIKGNHWQDKAGWIGWTPKSNSESAKSTWSFIETSFVSENIIGGIIRRFVGAILGKEPDWKVVAKQQAEKAASATNAFDKEDKAVTLWWTQNKVHDELKKWVKHKGAFGKAGIGIYIPRGLLVAELGVDGKEKNRLPFNKLEDVLSCIHVKVFHYGDIVEKYDYDFGQTYTVARRVGEPDLSTGVTPETEYEVCYVNRERKTILRRITQTGSSELEFDLGGNSLHYVLGDYKDALISESIKQQQKKVNNALTSENYAINNINFPETTLIDINMEGLPKEQYKVGDKTYWRYILDAGFGVFRNLKSVFYNTADGGEAAARGQVIQREGADPEKFAKVAENTKAAMFQSCGMLYQDLANSEYASGESKRESTTDYQILLEDSRTKANNIGVWAIETPLRLAFRFTGELEKMNTFMVTFLSNISLGKLSVDERRLMLDEVLEGKRSTRNYMTKAEVTDDPQGEINAITDEIKTLPQMPVPQTTGNGNGTKPNALVASGNGAAARN